MGCGMCAVFCMRDRDIHALVPAPPCNTVNAQTGMHKSAQRHQATVQCIHKLAQTPGLCAGLARINDDIGTSFRNQAIIIAAVTLLATVSVVTGVKVGIRRLSEINFIIAQCLLFVFFFQDDTWYLLNAIVQSLGFYVQWFIQLGNWCNAWVNAPAGAP